tara:strand:- start:1389 stop:1526 length:138 start_codon:yes stop_codon:yes gene_type:complete
MNKEEKEEMFNDWLDECPVDWIITSRYLRTGKPSDWNYSFMVDDE